MSTARVAREVGVAATVIVGVAAMMRVAHTHYPVQAWLVWRYLLYWVVGVGWLAACASAGWRLLTDGLRVRLPAADAALMSLASGVLLFFWALFIAGLLGGLTPTFAVVLPLLMLASGGRAAWQHGRRLLSRVLGRIRVTGAAWLAVSFGTVALAMIYLSVSTPANIGFDAAWYHLPIAEHFSAAHAVVPFREGWYLGAYPHLASVLYTWAFLLPGAQVFDRVLLAAHLEWFLFLVTVFSVPLLVRRLVPRAPPGTWAVMFLFPSVFLYDGGLFVGADHVLAFWVVPAYLALLRVERRLAPRAVVLLVLMLSGAILTKYQAMYVLLPVGVRVAWCTWRGSTRATLPARAWAGPGVALASGLLLTSPHWLANVLWYGDPFFPALHRHLPVRPWSADATRELGVFYQAALWQPQGGWMDKALATARALVTFSFEPHDWPTYHGDVPIFGSLFTVLSFAALFLRGARGVRLLALSTLSGVALWFITSHQDRYLQCLLPWMVAVSASVLVLAARQLPRVKPLLLLLLGMQAAWGADVYFIPAKDNSHENDRPSPIKAAVDLASSGYRGDHEARLHPFAPWEDLGRSLPAAAKVLVHERYLHLGLGRMAMTDLPGWQSAISYARLATPNAISDALRGLGVTHVVWETGQSHLSDSLAGDLAFLRFVGGAAASAPRFGAFAVVALEDLRPATSSPSLVASYACPAGEGVLRELVDGAVDPGGRAVPPLERAPPPPDAGFAVVDRTCRGASSPTGWTLALRRGADDVFIPAPATL